MEPKWGPTILMLVCFAIGALECMRKDRRVATLHFGSPLAVLPRPWCSGVGATGGGTEKADELRSMSCRRSSGGYSR